jgi:two-component system sensor histidine kinase FlrB
MSPSPEFPGIAGPAQPASNPELRRILDALPAGVVVIDGDGRVEDCNAAAHAMLGSTPGEALRGMLWRSIVERVLPGAARAAGEVDGITLADGRQVTVATAPLGDGPGQLVLLSDVTETRAVRALVERRQRLFSLGEMLASLSHQIRTPLASALLYVSQLEHAALGDETRRRCAGKLRGCIDHVNRLTRDMLAFAGGGALNTAEFSVAALLADFRGLSAGLIASGDCRLDIIDHGADARLNGNRDALATALQNLLENAVHACAKARANSAGERGGHIRLLARRVGDTVEITLSDDGTGIAPDLRARVLEPFFTTKPQGSGLGLAVARAVAQAHQGVLWIDSEEGLGTTVGMRLPLAMAASAAADGELRRNAG